MCLYYEITIIHRHSKDYAQLTNHSSNELWFCTSSSAMNRLTNRFCYSGGDLKGTIGIGIDIVCDMEEEEAAKLLYWQFLYAIAV